MHQLKKEIALSIKREKENGPDKILEKSTNVKTLLSFSWGQNFMKFYHSFQKRKDKNSLKPKKKNKVGSKYCQHVLACLKCVYVYVEGGGGSVHSCKTV